MTATLQLSDVQRDQFAATGCIVIDGEFLRTPMGDEWLAPEGWRILTEPCPTCGGTGKPNLDEWVVLPPMWQNMRCPNPDCVDGRRVVTLTATCDVCGGNGSQIVGWNDLTPIVERCTRVVTLGRFSIPALLPVVLCRGSHEYPDHDALIVVPRPINAAFIFTPNGPLIDALLDPLPHPGQFVAIPEPVE